MRRARTQVAARIFVEIATAMDMLPPAERTSWHRPTPVEPPAITNDAQQSLSRGNVITRGNGIPEAPAKPEGESKPHCAAATLPPVGFVASQASISFTR